MDNNTNKNYNEVLDLASEIGHVMLENGAEVARVNDSMSRVARYYGAENSNFYVLSNGVFATGTPDGSRKGSYAKSAFIPLKGTHFDKVIASSDLCFGICAGKYTIQQARARLEEIKRMPERPFLLQSLGSALGSAGFCAVFGGTFLDCAAAGAVGFLVYMFILYVSSAHLSKFVGGTLNAVLMSCLCILFYRAGFGDNLSNIIIGALMPLVPGLAFTNGVRDLASSDYLSGITRMTDAAIGFFCLVVGLAVGFMVDGSVHGGIMALTEITVSQQTYGIFWQAIAAFMGTAGFSIFFSVPPKYYLTTGLIGMVGWLIYILLTRMTGIMPAVSAVISATVICILSRSCAVHQKCPNTVFLVCGLLPLIPGAGLFWSAYYLFTADFRLALIKGYDALNFTIAIVMGIIIAMELPQKWFIHLRKKEVGKKAGKN